MRFKPFKDLTLGKSKEKPAADQGGDEFKAIAANRIADMEKQIHTKTKDLEAKVQEIQGLVPKSDEKGKNGDIHRGPHGPLGELTLDTDEKPDDGISIVDITDDDESEEEGEEIKLVEVKASKVAPSEKKKKEKPVEAEASSEETPAEADATSEKAPDKEAEIKPDENGDSLNNLFSDEEEEENPLANLIKSLPDVTAQEIIDDIAEIKGIIKEWQKK
jgi:hypothetical protein